MADLKTAENIEIRRLNTKDFWTIVNILRKGGKEAFSRMAQLEQNASVEERGMFIMDIGMEFAQKELSAFLADLAGMTKEEYENGSFDLTLTIIEQLAERENLEDFIKRVAALAKKFSKQQAAAPMAAQMAK